MTSIRVFIPPREKPAVSIKNTLYVVSGMPAAGKSTIAKKLALRQRACLIDIDTATEPVVRAAMLKLTGNPDDRDSSLFKDTFREPVYEALLAIANENLPHCHAIVTGPFTKELTKANWPSQLQAKLTAPCRVKCLFVHCSPQLRRTRLIERANPRDTSKLADWEQHLAYYDETSFPSYPHYAIDTGNPEALDLAIENGLLD